MKKISLLIVLMILVSGMALSSTEFDITLYHNNDFEKKAQELLIELDGTYDLSPFVFTKKIIIKSRSIPHSHPVLILNTRFIDNPTGFLSTFLHEQMHWFWNESVREESVEEFINKMKEKYPNIPVGAENGGARTEYSSYLHLGINLLEYDALRYLRGEEVAKKWFREKKIYWWINAKMLEDYLDIKSIINKLELSIIK